MNLLQLIWEHNRLKHSRQCSRDDMALNVMDLFLEACMNNACVITFENIQLQTASYISHNYVHV